ncbi:MAG: Crp/Fnr family transcriptional regulator [Candidatus Thorarchaeota archaeon]
MLTVIEKVILLQSIDIFSEVPTEQLASLAAITEEASFAAGENIFHENDFPDALYVVVEGQVRLHRDGVEISVAKEGDAFGTWALLDDEPRVAGATVDTETRLLRIDREDFIDLLADHVQIVQGVLKMVVRRLRRLIGRI